MMSLDMLEASCLWYQTTWRFVSHNASYTHGAFILIFIDEDKCSVFYEPIMGNKRPGGRHVVKDNIFYPFCSFFFRLHYFWICCLDNMSDCFCFWLRSLSTVSCPRFVLRIFTTFVVSNRTPILNLDFSTGTRYLLNSKLKLQFTSAPDP